MTWSKVPTLVFGAPQKSGYLSDDGLYRVSPAYLTGRGGRRLKRVVWKLTEGGRMIGRPFNSARLAKAFAEALAALGDNRRARAELIRDGAGWCYDQEREWRSERDRRWREVRA